MKYIIIASLSVMLFSCTEKSITGTIIKKSSEETRDGYEMYIEIEYYDTSNYRLDHLEHNITPNEYESLKVGDKYLIKLYSF